MSVDAWKHSSLPIYQLDLNRKELSGSYPDHWKALLLCMRSINFTGKTFIDIGCGVGATYQLLMQEKLLINYIGIDFSTDMIETAKNAWGYSGFFVEDFHDSKRNYSNSIIYCNGLLDILPDGVAELNKILEFGAPVVILNRINVGTSKSLTKYIAYDTIECYRYIFSQKEFVDTVASYRYKITHKSVDCYLLQKV
jgi:trans-aconitate methyltransferase